jgi:hypothetical protein
MFASDGTLKVTDFGIAQVLGGASSMATRDGSVLGTPAYMAPEQAQNHELTPATDVYAVGTVLYELLTGTLPFGTDLGALQVLYAHAFTSPRPVLEAAPTLAAPLAEVVMRAVATQAAERQQSAEELGVAIAQAAARVWGPAWLVRSRIPLLTGGPIAAAALQPTGAHAHGAPPTEVATGALTVTSTSAGGDAAPSASASGPGTDLDAPDAEADAPDGDTQAGPALSPVRPAGSRERPPDVDATLGPRDLVPLDEMVQPGGLAAVPGAPSDGGPAHRPRTPRGRGRLIVAGTIGLVAAVTGTALGLVATDGPTGRRKAAVSPPSTTSAPAAQPVATVVARPPACPLSGLPAPNGTVPQRPALAIKVDNVPAARPQSALDQADVVFEEPIEGHTTRLLAVFQCQAADMVGDVRSARAVDASVLDQLSRPIFVHIGGIGPVLSRIAQADVLDADLAARGPQVDNPPGRYAPYDTYVSTATAWGLHSDDTSPPAPLFTYAAAPPAGRPVTSVHIPYSSSNDTTWAWDLTGRQWLRSYGSVPATLGDGSRVTAANIVVLVVQVSNGPWVEDANYDLEVQSQLVGTGPAVVFRDGVEVAGTWQRPTDGEPTKLLGTDGSAIPLAPGETWVEIVPSNVPVSSAP